MANRKIQAIYREYGKDHAHKCADCPNLCIHATTSHTLYKCMAYGDSCSSATDWSQRWTACGLYGKTLPIDCFPLIRLTRTKRQKKPIDGQIGFFEEEK
nr:MAG TPA: hypothetical protein [Caudoviricetes sp.]